MSKIDIGKDFSEDPGGRYYTDGPGSGEQFREELLWPKVKKLKKGEKILITLDNNVESYGSSFLSEGFAGIVKFGYMKSTDLLNKLEFSYTDSDFEFYANSIKRYISESKFASRKYNPTK
jgi:hypothetical protein